MHARWIALTWITLMLATPALAQDVSMSRRTVTVPGAATVHVVPDEIILGVGIETFAPALAAAHRESEAEGLRLLAALKGLGIATADIRTDVLVVEAKPKGSDPQPGTVGFLVRRAYSVTLPDVKKYEQAVSVALSNGANRIMGSEFRDKRLREHRDEARRMAVKAAREKAALLANELGAKLGPVRSISEYGSGSGGFRSWWGWAGNNYGGYASQMSQNVAIDRGGGDGDDQGSLPLGRIAVTASVQVTFDLAP